MTEANQKPREAATGASACMCVCLWLWVCGSAAGTDASSPALPDPPRARRLCMGRGDDWWRLTLRSTALRLLMNDLWETTPDPKTDGWRSAVSRERSPAVQVPEQTKLSGESSVSPRFKVSVGEITDRLPNGFALNSVPSFWFMRSGKASLKAFFSPPNQDPILSPNVLFPSTHWLRLRNIFAPSGGLVVAHHL